MFASAKVVTMMAALAAERPAPKAAALMAVDSRARPIAIPEYSTGRPWPNFIPAQISGKTGKLSSSRYSGSAQLATRKSWLSVFSAKAI